MKSSARKGSRGGGGARGARKRESPEQAKRKRFIAVWWGLREALGGDGWDDWTDEEIVATMDSWVMDPAFTDRTDRDEVDELLEQSFDPRDVRGMR
jgi:hypothetical protein